MSACTEIYCALISVVLSVRFSIHTIQTATVMSGKPSGWYLQWYYRSARTGYHSTRTGRA